MSNKILPPKQSFLKISPKIKLLNHFRTISIILIIACALLITYGVYSWGNRINPINPKKEFIKNLNISLYLLGNWVVNNQTMNGDFVYQRDVNTGKEITGARNLFRQAYTLYTLSLFNKRDLFPASNIATQKGLNYFEHLSIQDQTDVGEELLETRRIFGQRQDYNNTSAFVLLSLIEYCEANPQDKDEYITAIKSLANYLVSTQLPTGGYKYKFSDPSQDPYTDGEVFYSLVRAYQLTHDPHYLNSAKRAGNYYIGFYGKGDFNPYFYSWGMQGFYYLYQVDPNDKYWLFMRQETERFFTDIGNYQSAYYVNKEGDHSEGEFAVYLEGLIHVAHIARKNDYGYYLKLKDFIEQSLAYLMAFQLNGPKSEKTSSFKEVIGGTCFGENCKTERIDITGHNLAAIYFYLQLLEEH